ncbi:MAG: helix-turn-helix transcriptional regulator [Clostridia bacterium]|nr:helix-turn-helix transcriptional regulator [Clostridia bacterium]
MNFTFGEKIKILRENKNISQTELGKAVNMTQRKVSYIECGKYEPSIDDIVALCKYFKVSADYLLSLPRNYRYPER